MAAVPVRCDWKRCCKRCYRDTDSSPPHPALNGAGSQYLRSS